MDTSNLKVLEKGYQVETAYLSEGWFHDHTITAKHFNTAKSKLVKILQDEEAVDSYGDKITFDNIHIRRYEDRDLVLFEDKPTFRNDVEKILRSRSRNTELESYLNDPTISYCYILKHGLFYADNSCGYVTPRHNAGIYTIEDGVSKAKSCEDLRIIPIDNTEHNSMTLSTAKASLGRMIIDEQDKEMWESVGEMIGLLESKYGKS